MFAEIGGTLLRVVARLTGTTKESATKMLLLTSSAMVETKFANKKCIPV